jgi:hypothetical protein
MALLTRGGLARHYQAAQHETTRPAETSVDPIVPYTESVGDSLDNALENLWPTIKV